MGRYMSIFLSILLTTATFYSTSVTAVRPASLQQQPHQAGCAGGVNCTLREQERRNIKSTTDGKQPQGEEISYLQRSWFAASKISSVSMEEADKLDDWKILAYLACPLVMLAVSLGLYCRTQKAEDLGDEVMKRKMTDEVASLAFHDEGLERKWMQASTAKAISLSARAVLFLVLVDVAEDIREFSLEGTSFLDCRIGPNYHRVLITLFIIEALMATLAVVCWKFPNEALYNVLLVAFIISEFAEANPPFKASCAQLVDACKDRQDAAEIVNTLECSLQARTEQQELMTTVLFMPWLLPRFSNFQHFWSGFFCLYVLATVINRSATNTVYFTWYHIGVSITVLTTGAAITHVRKKRLERAQRMVFLYDLKDRELTEQMFRIFQYMIPEHIITPMLLDPTGHIAESIDRISILFVVINDFGTIGEKMSPKELLDFLNDIFENMDTLCLENNVTKVETVGEEYVACTGVVPRDREEYEATKSHASSLARLVDVASKMLDLQSEKIKFKMGIHTGPIVAGVIGKKLPRFRLFGDTINTAARMMQKAPPGRLQFGVETKEDWPATVEVEDRGEVEMKGKGKVKAWLFPTEEELKKRREAEPGPKKLQAIKSGSQLDEPLEQEKPKPKKKGVLEALAAIENKAMGNLRAMGTMIGSFVNKDGSTSSFERPSTMGASFTSTGGEVDSTHEKFEEVLNEIARQKNDDTGVIGGKAMAPELEERWTKQFHADEVCHNLHSRITLGLCALSILTFVETVYMLFIGQVWRTPFEGWEGSWRPLGFVGCRGAIFMHMLVWWSVPDDLLLNNVALAQYGILTSICFICSLFFMSYCMIETGTIRDNYLENIEWIFTESEKMTEVKAPFDQVFTVLFFLVFYMVTTVQPLRFYQAFPLPLVAIALVAPFPKEDWWNSIKSEDQFYGREGRLLFIASSFIILFLAHETELGHRQRFKAAANKDIADKRITGILATLMPPMLVKDLRSGLSEQHHNYKAATIAQSDLCGFTKLASTRTPQEVVKFVSDLFGRFDELTDVHGVYKVETIGDAYIAGMAEQPLTERNEPVSVVLFGLDMIKQCLEWARDLGVDVTCRVGIHHGECVGGVVGQDMQRYHLFGHFMVALDTLEATSEEGVAQLSSACKEAVEKQLKDEKRSPEAAFGGFQARLEGVLKTSKGEVHELDEVGGPTFLVRGRKR
jgi:class 3 adenylate cyclase